VLVALYKPYGYLSQFTPEPGSRWRTLAEMNLPARIYPLGRLDADSEGLLLLSDEPGLNTQLLDPQRGHAREYWAQVEGVPSTATLHRLAAGVEIKGERTRPCEATLLTPAPGLPPRDPPIRVRKSIPDSWISLRLTEGKNRQVRRMTAAVGHPTLRLHRAAIGRLMLSQLELGLGAWIQLSAEQRRAVLG